MTWTANGSGGGAGTIAGTMPRSSMFSFLAGILSDPAFGLLLHGREMQTPGWLPVIVQDIDLAARLRSNGRSRRRRIPGMAAHQIRQRCSPDSNSDRSCLA